MNTLLNRLLAMALVAIVAASSGISAARADGAIVVQNHYYPKPGLAQEVLRTRLEASAVRKQLGLEVGRVLLRTSDSDAQPYVIWECDYPSLEARQKDAALAESAPAFKAVQKKMGELIARFDRSVWSVQPLPER
jgi:hypothetical protein